MSVRTPKEPAFPCLRDWFAGQALSAAAEAWAADDISDVHPDCYSGWFKASDMAKRAYELADAMLLEREKAQRAREAAP